MAKKKDHEIRARDWLRENSYDDVANLIDEIQAEWEKQGKRTRRNWWEVLAGGKDGKPRTIAGREFPVLKVAQRRQGLSITKNAIRRNRNEKAPEQWEARGGAVTRASETKK